MTNEQIDNVENIESNDSKDKSSVIVNTNMKNYLDSQILKVKSYSADEISEIDKSINLSINSEESDIYDKNIVE